MTDAPKTVNRTDMETPRPRGWLAKTFGLGRADPPAQSHAKGFDFVAMQRSLASLEGKRRPGE